MDWEGVQGISLLILLKSSRAQPHLLLAIMNNICDISSLAKLDYKKVQKI
jgi:hypothetical protein